MGNRGHNFHRIIQFLNCIVFDIKKTLLLLHPCKLILSLQQRGSLLYYITGNLHFLLTCNIKYLQNPSPSKPIRGRKAEILIPRRSSSFRYAARGMCSQISLFDLFGFRDAVAFWPVRKFLWCFIKVSYSSVIAIYYNEVPPSILPRLSLPRARSLERLPFPSCLLLTQPIPPPPETLPNKTYAAGGGKHPIFVGSSGMGSHRGLETYGGNVQSAPSQSLSSVILIVSSPTLLSLCRGLVSNGALPQPLQP